jgi:[acyl-carrier-protein] S-malonyltransferase
MQPARERLERDLSVTEFHLMEFPVVANVTAQPVMNASEIPALLSAQVTGSVRWVESVQALASLGVTEYLEFGPGSVLTGMVKRIVPDAKTFNISGPADLDAYLKEAA